MTYFRNKRFCGSSCDRETVLSLLWKPLYSLVDIFIQKKTNEYRGFHNKDKTVSRSSYLYDWNPYENILLILKPGTEHKVAMV